MKICNYAALFWSIVCIMWAVAFFSLMLSGCTQIHYTAADGTKIDAVSVLSNKILRGTLEGNGNNRKLVIQEYSTDQTTGAAAIVGAAVEAAVKGVKP